MKIKHQLLVGMNLQQLRKLCLEEEVRVTDLLDSGLLLELGPDEFVLTIAPLKQDRTAKARVGEP